MGVGVCGCGCVWVWVFDYSTRKECNEVAQKFMPNEDETIQIPNIQYHQTSLHTDVIDICVFRYMYTPHMFVHMVKSMLHTIWCKCWTLSGKSANPCNPEVKRMCWLAQANVSLSISQ